MFIKYIWLNKKENHYFLFCELESRPSEEIWIFTEADRTFCTFHSTFSTEISNISSKHEIGTPSNKERGQAELNFCWRVCWHLSLLSSLPLPPVPPSPSPHTILSSSHSQCNLMLKNKAIVSTDMLHRQWYFFLTSS